MSMFRRATKEQAKLRLAMIGLAGSGKTYSAPPGTRCVATASAE